MLPPHDTETISAADRFLCLRNPNILRVPHRRSVSETLNTAFLKASRGSRIVGFALNRAAVILVPLENCQTALPTEMQKLDVPYSAMDFDDALYLNTQTAPAAPLRYGNTVVILVDRAKYPKLAAR